MSEHRAPAPPLMRPSDSSRAESLSCQHTRLHACTSQPDSSLKTHNRSPPRRGGKQNANVKYSIKSPHGMQTVSDKIIIKRMHVKHLNPGESKVKPYIPRIHCVPVRHARNTHKKNENEATKVSLNATPPERTDTKTTHDGERAHLMQPAKPTHRERNAQCKRADRPPSP